MKKLIAAVLMFASSESFAAAEASRSFTVLEVDGNVVESLSEMPTEDLCSVASSSFALCDSNVYNVANVIITLRDVNETRACQRGYELGYKMADEALALLPEDEVKAIQNCSYVQ